MTAFLVRYRFAIAAALIAAFAMWARGWGIGAEPMWLDEGYSAYAASKGWAFLWQVVPRYETHPPFYYSLLRVWTLVAGEGLVAHRMLGLVCGLALLPVIAFAAGRLAVLAGARRGPAILAALAMIAVSPMLVEMTREVRPYPLMILTYAGAIWALLAICARRAEGLPLAGRAFAVLVGCTALMLWLHNLGPLYAAALGLALLCVVRVKAMAKADWLWLAGGAAIALLIWLPALWILLDQAPEWVKATWLKWSTHDLWRRATAVHWGPSDDMRAAAAILSLIGGIFLWRAMDGRRLLAALLILAILPIAVSLIVSETVAPIFIIRTMTPLVVPAILLMALAFGVRHRPALLAAIVALIWLVIAQAGFDIRAREHPRRDWYRTMQWLAPRFRPGDLVFAYPNEGALPFDRAVRDYGLHIPSRPIPSAIPSLNPPPGSWYVSGSRGVPSLDRAHLRAIAEEPGTRAIPTIWLLRLGPWAYDKGDVFLEELSRGRVTVGRWKDGAIDVVGLRKKEISQEEKFWHRPTRAEAETLGKCLDQHKGASNPELSVTCVDFSPVQRIQGFWLYGFETSQFIESDKSELPTAEVSLTTPWLEIMPGSGARAPRLAPLPQAFRITFMGRRSIAPRFFGNGIFENQVVVDRIISIGPGHFPKVRDLFLERYQPKTVTPAKAEVSGEKGVLAA